jgi:hypothetical protein
VRHKSVWINVMSRKGFVVTSPYGSYQWPFFAIG